MSKFSKFLFIIFFSLNLTQTTIYANIKNQQINIKFNEIENFDLQVSKEIKENLKQKQKLAINNALLYKYYKKHKFRPFFIKYGRVNKLAKELIKHIREDSTFNSHFDFNKIDTELELLKHNPIIKNIVKFDFLLVSTYYKYMTLLSKGEINWIDFQERLQELRENSDINANWQRYRVKDDFRLLLYKASKNSNIFEAINRVTYTFLNAKELLKKIEEYKNLSKDGGYIKIPFSNRALKLGKYYPEIKDIRRRLLQNNYLVSIECKNQELQHATNSDEIETIKIDKSTSSIGFNERIEDNKQLNNCEELYDKELQNAIKRFQKNHGLIADGIIGINTLKALNMPIEEKIKKMKLNLERMRWLPRDLGEKYILVNIPDFHLKMYSNNTKIIDMPIIVGDSKHPTPIFSHRLSQVVLNPYWRIPQGIVKDEIIPALVENSNYLEEEEIKVHKDWDHNSYEFDTSSIDWSTFLNSEIIGDIKNSPMRFIQIPGDKNPLGRIKFLFPNQYSVYLHDTPFKNLFEHKNRALSHGCIRLAKPKELLKTIFLEFEYSKLEKILKNKERVEIDLKNKIPVHIIYLTSWVDEHGELQFRDDIYGYDKMQEELIF